MGCVINVLVFGGVNCFSELMVFYLITYLSYAVLKFD